MAGSIILRLVLVFLHLNSSLHQRSWEKARLEAQRYGAHADAEPARNLYRLALDGKLLLLEFEFAVEFGFAFTCLEYCNA
ncbi:MAG TPA: hypothetical protein V6C86_19445 [Oculatellaceae cyanobacterium]